MERTCQICQTFAYDDGQTICASCGAELPPVEDESMDDDALSALELDLGELEDNGRLAVTPELAGGSDEEEGPGETVDEPAEEPEPEEGPVKEPAADKDDWDPGIVGPGAVEEDEPEEEIYSFEVDEEEPQEETVEDTESDEPVAEEPDEPVAEQEPAKVEGDSVEEEDTETAIDEDETDEEEVELAEDEFLCPSCNGVMKAESAVCPHCSADTQYLIRCPTCGYGIDQVAEICPHCYTDLSTVEIEGPEEEEVPSEEPEEGGPDSPDGVSPDMVEIPEEGENGKLPDKERKKLEKKLLKEQKALEKELAKGKITEEEFEKRLDEIRISNGFGPLGGIVAEEPGEDIRSLEEGENGKLSDKEKKKMLKKLRKEQRALEKELESGKIDENEFQQRLDEIRMGNGFGPIGGFVLEEAESEELVDDDIIPDNRREARALKKERMKEILAEERREGLFTYYNLSLITLFFFIFLAVFVFFEFVFIVGNITSQTDVPAVAFSIAPTFGDVIGIPALMFAVIVTLVDAILHLWDRRTNLVLSLIPTGIMIGGLFIDFTYHSQFVGADRLWIFALLFGLIAMVFLDIASIWWYPPVLNAQDREELEIYLEKEDELSEVQQQLEEDYQKMIEEEEEKLRIKDEEISDIQTKLDDLSQQISQEEEKLRLKEEEVSAIKAELDLKTQELMEEEEQIRMKEQEMESIIQTELEKRAEDMVLEEEEKLKMKEEEVIRAKNELEIQKNLFDENREKLRLKEQEMMSLRTELENQMRMRMEEEDRLRLKEAASKMLERGKQKRVLFPFSAMVGQEKMKLSLILNAIYPEVGGVLIRGQKGTGKSVSVRGLAEILPDIEVTGCKFNCDPAEPDKFCTECAAKHRAGRLETYSRPVQVVDLPLNITEDRLVGSIDIEKILTQGVKSFEPGILAEAHRGILYVDEINLLDDYIVDILLDAASSGVVTIEREGISISHPSRFIIVGSMNPEEGELRPQILDRIALQSDVVGIKEVEQRINIVKRREEFTVDPMAFREKYEDQRQELSKSIEKARDLLPTVSTPPRIYTIIAQICMDFNVDGHRADIIIERAARANAAFEGRGEVTADDVVAAASMALPHRMRRRPYEEEEFSEETLRKLVTARESEIEG